MTTEKLLKDPTLNKVDCLITLLTCLNTLWIITGIEITILKDNS